MKSIDVANGIVDQYHSDVALTNLKLNKLVYFSQVLSLKETGEPLFEDPIQAWSYGPVEPLVYYRFQKYGRDRIHAGETYEQTEHSQAVIKRVMDRMGKMTAFDLVRLSHRDGGAWKRVYLPHENAEIAPETILESSDMSVFDSSGRTLSDGIAAVDKSWPNALRMLENT